MQSFKQLKRNAKTTVRHNYWKIVIVCFFVALAAGLYSSAISLGDFTASDETERQDEAVENVKNSLILSLDGFIDGIDSVKAISPHSKMSHNSRLNTLSTRTAPSSISPAV